MSTRTITVKGQAQEVTYLDKAGEEKLLGKIMMEEYGENEARAFTFYPDQTNPHSRGNKNETGYSLGIGSGSMAFVNPADAQRILKNRGYEIKDQVAYKGGLMMRTTYVNTNNELPDLLNWDESIWATYNRERGKMFPMISLDTNLVMGHMALRFQQGLYRLICTNGLVGTVLAMPSLEVRHSEWDVDGVEEELEAMVDDNAWRNYLNRPVGRTKDFVSTARLLNRYMEERASEKGMTDTMRSISGLLRGFSKVSEPIATEYVRQIEAAADNVGETMEAIYLVNAYTNAVNLHRARTNELGAYNALQQLDSVLADTISTTALAAMFN